MAGGRGVGPAGLRAVVGGSEPAVLDLHTGDLEPLSGLDLGTGESASPRPVRGGLVVSLSREGVSGRTVLLRPGRPPAPLGTDVRVTPLRTGELLVTSYAPRSARWGRYATRPGSGGPGGARPACWSRRGTPRRPAGRAVGQPGQHRRATCCCSTPAPASRGGGSPPDGSSSATGDTVVAHLPADCGLDCPLAVTDLTGGRSRDYPTPDPGPPATGRFSPDGRRLALAVPGHYFSGQRSVRPGFVAVLDLATGAVVRVPGVETPAARIADVDWAPDGRLLVLAVWSGRRAARSGSGPRTARPRRWSG